MFHKCSYVLEMRKGWVAEVHVLNIYLTCEKKLYWNKIKYFLYYNSIRGGSRTTATSKVELFVIIVNGWKPLIIIPKSSTLDVAAVLNPPLSICVLSICKEDSAKKKRSGIPKVFDISSNFKVFLTGFQTMIFDVTIWKLLWTLRRNFPLKFVLAQN